MKREMLYPDEKSDLKRRSTLHQSKSVVSVVRQGGYTPILFDQFDYYDCGSIHSHKVAITFDNNHIGYVFKDKMCPTPNINFVTFNDHGIKTLIDENSGMEYQAFVDEENFIVFDDDTTAGTYDVADRRVGVDYVLSDESLPPVE